MRITPDGRITIPEELRARYGLTPDTDVEFKADADGIRIVAAPPRSAGEQAVAALRAAGRHWVGPATTEEAMDLLRGHRGDPALGA